MENYLLIHGSFENNAARETLEVFYGSNNYQGIITGTIPLNIGKLSVSAYSSLMDSDLFIITGGNKIHSGLASNTISYMNVTKLFTNTQMVSVEWDYSCITKYNATQQSILLDDYLLDQRQLRYEVLLKQGTTYDISLKGNGDIDLTLKVSKGDIGQNNISMVYGFGSCNGACWYDQIRMEAELDEISRLTQVDATNDLSAFWMEWDSQYWYVLLDCILFVDESSNLLRCDLVIKERRVWINH